MLKREVVVIGGGLAGLSAAIEASSAGAQVLLVDADMRLGRQMFRQIHTFFQANSRHTGADIGWGLLEKAKKNGVEIWAGAAVVGLYAGKRVGIRRNPEDSAEQTVVITARKLIVTTGLSKHTIQFEGWTTPGVMGIGAAQTMTNMEHKKPGERIVLFGSSNMVLLAAGQLMQEGCEIAALVDTAPGILGDKELAEPLIRADVPIYTGYTIVGVGEERGHVSSVTIAIAACDGQPIPGTEKAFQADTVALGNGLKPTTEIASLLECRTVEHPTMGRMPMCSANQETSVRGTYAAGDAVGAEGANEALESGCIAGIHAAQALGYSLSEEAQDRKEWVHLCTGAVRRQSRCIAEEEPLIEYANQMGIRCRQSVSA